MNLAIAKAIRFGLFNHHESQRYSNFDQLRFEIQDAQTALSKLDEHLASLARIREAGRSHPSEDWVPRFEIPDGDGAVHHQGQPKDDTGAEGEDGARNHSPASTAGLTDDQRRLGRDIVDDIFRRVFSDDKEVPASAAPHRSDRTGA